MNATYQEDIVLQETPNARTCPVCGAQTSLHIIVVPASRSVVTPNTEGVGTVGAISDEDDLANATWEDAEWR